MGEILIGQVENYWMEENSFYISNEIFIKKIYILFI